MSSTSTPGTSAPITTEKTGVAKWVIDPSHSLVEFSVKHMMIATVKGRFGAIDGVITVDPNDLTTASVHVKIDVSSIDTREVKRDEHLRSADFFDVEKFPQITFQSRSITPAGDGEYNLVGDLTMHGVTRPVTLVSTFTGQGKDPWGNDRIAFSAEGKVDRKEFGLTWNAALEAGGVLVGDQVKISIEVEAIRQG